MGWAPQAHGLAGSEQGSDLDMLDSYLGRPGTAPARWLDQIAQRFVRLGIPPNSLSYAALAFGLTAAWLFSIAHRKSAFLMLVLSGGMDAIDGRVARLGRGATPWGGVLDLTFDRIVEAAVLLGVALPKKAWHGPALLLACTWYVNLCVFLAVGAASSAAKAKLIDYPPGLLERSEGLLFALVVSAAPGFTPLALYAYAALEVVTAAQRFLNARRALEN
jgi:phosphatidylglycerophosphate synthase